MFVKSCKTRLRFLGYSVEFRVYSLGKKGIVMFQVVTLVHNKNHTILSTGAGCLGPWAVTQSCDTFSLSLSHKSSLSALLVLSKIQNGNTTGFAWSAEMPKWQRSVAWRWPVCLDPSEWKLLFCVDTESRRLDEQYVCLGCVAKSFPAE